MSTNTIVLETESFFFKKGDVGCLLIHGFSGSPPEMKQLGEYLSQRDITTLGVKLAGHGETPDIFAKTGWRDWTRSAEDGLIELKRHCKNIFIAGLSMGGAITLYLASQHRVNGIITYAGAVYIKDIRLIFLPLLSLFVKYIPQEKDKNTDLTNPDAINDIFCYDKIPVSCIKELLAFLKIVRSNLHKITHPALIMHGICDRTLSPKNAEYIFKKIPSKDKKLVYLGYSGHALTVDSEKEDVFRLTYDFIKKHTS